MALLLEEEDEPAPPDIFLRRFHCVFFLLLDFFVCLLLTGFSVLTELAVVVVAALGVDAGAKGTNVSALGRNGMRD